MGLGRDFDVMRAAIKRWPAGDPAMTDVERRWRCAMQVKLTDRRTLEHATKAAKGSYENPLTAREEEEKALDLMVPVLGRAPSAELLPQPGDLDQVADVGALRRLYQC